MTRLTRHDIERIARLARLKLTEEELDRMPKELSSILSYVEMLKELDTTGIMPTAQVTGLSNVFRDDVVRDGALADAILETSPLPVQERQITVPHAHGS